MAKQITVEEPGGKSSIFHQYAGFTIADDFVKHALPAKDLALQIQWIKETEIREDDVIICAFPKTGTHWTWEILNMIQQGIPDYVKETKVTAMLEFTTQEMTSSLTSPRVLNTHFTHNLLPAGIKEKQCKIVHVLRNPKDVCVSMYFHFKADNPELPPMDWFIKSFRGEVGVHPICSYLWYIKHWGKFCLDNPDYPVINVYNPTHYHTIKYKFTSLQVYLKETPEGHRPMWQSADPICSYLWYIKHWEKFCSDNPDYPVIHVFYEDLKKNPGAEITRLSKFLGKDLNADTIAAIAEKCQFANLKRANDDWKNDRVKRRTDNGKSFIYRKGEIGDWKNYLTVAENEAFDEWIEREMQGSDIVFQYE